MVPALVAFVVGAGLSVGSFAAWRRAEFWGAMASGRVVVARHWQSDFVLVGGLAFSAVLAIGLATLARRRRLGETMIRRGALRAERALLRLKLSDERFRDYVTTASDWYWETDGAYRFTVVADSAAQCGIDRSRLVGLLRLTLDEDPAWGDSRLEVLSKHVAFRGLRYEYQLDGGVLNLSLNGLPIFHDDGRFRGFRGSASDITALLETESAHREALWAAEQDNRAKSDFLANMSHEIRTPMNGVLGMVQILRHSGLDDEQRRMCEIIYQSANGLLKILNDILDYSKLEAGKIQMEAIACRLTDLIDSVVLLMHHAAEAKDVALVYQGPAAPPPLVLVDPTRLRQVLLNLVANAIKFSDSGTVSVRLQTELVDAGHLQVELAVADQGIGISATAQRSLFQRFNQADASATRLFGGTGLGLAITHELITLMGGEIAVHSTPGIGSCFTISLTLPIAVDADSAVAVDPYVPLEGPVVALDLLVAEDDDINQIVIRRFLEAQGHTVTVVGNGEEAVAAVQAHRFDLVLMDMMMPVADGITATRTIRLLPPPQGLVPIVALTANAMVGDSDRYLAAGMNGYVSKPIDRPMLFRTMEQVLGVRVAEARRGPVPIVVAPAAPAATRPIEDFIASLDVS
jgi:signal transduction histidine kinase/CheY-like chemotaxis protein